jgi:hypothetical protein
MKLTARLTFVSGELHGFPHDQPAAGLLLAAQTQKDNFSDKKLFVCSSIFLIIYIFNHLI